MPQPPSVPLALSVPFHGASGVLRVGVVRHVAFVALAVVMAVPAASQTVATSFGELRLKVEPGDIVYVTDDIGKSEQKARILDLTAASLTVSIGGVRRDLDESNVMRIRQRFPDPLKTGALIGFLVGAAASVAGAKALESPAGSCTAGCVAGNILYGGGLGALVGLGIDALVQGRKDIYVRSPSRSSQDIAVRPFVMSQAKGLNISLRF